MKILIRMAGLLVLISGLAGLVRGQALLPGTTAGMKVEDVQKLFPEAHAPENTEPLPGGHVLQLLEVDRLVIAEHAFRVKFFFNDERLVKVTLFESGDILEKDFAKLRDLIRAKYGHEDSTTSSDAIQLNWKAVQTTLRLKWTPARRDEATLLLTYEAPIPKESERL
ncbi:MAG: hypothetical protein ABI222_04975 [Opitutaceae bacterium]